MNANSAGVIVVGVTGPRQETAAMRFAAECARREGAEVVLAHAVHVALPPPPPSMLMSFAEAADVAELVLKEVGEEFQELSQGSVPFRTVAVSGPPAQVLADLSAEAQMVVVQHRSSSWLGRLFVGSTSAGAAAHSACPVVSVPQNWEASSAPGEVVVGVHESGEPLPVVAAAFEWAERTGATLRIVHAWRLDAAYDDLITARVAEEWRTERLRLIDAKLTALRDSHPTVQYELEVRHQWPAQTLVEDSGAASMVVVGRHSRHGRPTHYLGSVARTVLREASGPVMVVPLTPSPATAEDYEITDDEVSPQT